MNLTIKCIHLVIKKTRSIGLLNTVLYFAEGLCYILPLKMLQFLIDDFVNSISYTNIVNIFLYAISFLPEIVIRFFRSRIEYDMSKKLANTLYEDIYMKVSSINYEKYEDKDLYNKFALLGNEPYEKIKDYYLIIMQTVKSFFVLLSSAIIIYNYSIKLSVLFVLTMIAVVLFSTMGMNIFNKAIKQQTLDERWVNYYKSLFENKNTNYELRINNAIDWINSLREKREKKIIKQMYLAMFKSDVVYNISTIFIIIWSVIVINSLYHGVCGGYIQIGVFVVLINAVITIMSDVENLSSNFADVLQGGEYIKYYTDIMEYETAQEEKTENYVNSKYVISLDNVNFQFPQSSEMVLRNISFDVKRNETIAIVGKNGAGKSTLLKIICGLLQPCSGSIKVEQNKNIGVLFQDFARYCLTLRENINIADFGIDDIDKVVEALKNGFSEDIYELANKNVDTELGRLDNDGIELSGGQWQRVALSRGIFNNPDIILLDEPTSSMDPLVESQIYKVFFELTKHKTSIIISHRLATARMADKVILLNNGLIAEVGSHMELMERKGMYYSMYKQQSSLYCEGENGDE